MKRWIVRAVAVAGAALLIMQLVPYGRDHANPAVIAEPAWQPEVRELARKACFDCHSNQTHWPWYSSIAPASWLVQRDVDAGRRVLNFSEWHRSQEEAGESGEAIAEGEMPLAAYVWLHPSARLSAAERERLIAGLSALGPGKHASEQDDD